MFEDLFCKLNQWIEDGYVFSRVEVKGVFRGRCGKNDDLELQYNIPNMKNGKRITEDIFSPCATNISIFKNQTSQVINDKL